MPLVLLLCLFSVAQSQQIWPDSQSSANEAIRSLVHCDACESRPFDVLSLLQIEAKIVGDAVDNSQAVRPEQQADDNRPANSTTKGSPVDAHKKQMQKHVSGGHQNKPQREDNAENVSKWYDGLFKKAATAEATNSTGHGGPHGGASGSDSAFSETDDEEHAHHESWAAACIGGTLLASISFQMCLTYLVNHSDPDIRKASYEVISQTISIFCAVLIFMCAWDLLKWFLIAPGASVGMVCALATAHMLAWFIGTQIVLMHICGLMGGRVNPERSEQVELQLKCWALLMAHITGFAGINAVGSVQQAYFNDSPVLAVLGVYAAAGTLYILAVVAHRCRTMVLVPEEQSEYKAKWIAEAVESENDSFGLTISFTLVNALRFVIGGALPNIMGQESKATAFSHTDSEIMALLGVGVALLMVRSATIWFDEFLVHSMPNLLRVVDLVSIAAAMSFSWCAYYAGRWFVASGRGEHFENNYTAMNLILAYGLSIVAFTFIFIFDWLADQDWTGEAVDQVLRDCLGVFGFVIGFAWEQTFDFAEEGIAHFTPQPHLSLLLMALGSVSILVPAWRFYILPMVLQSGWKFGFVLEHVEEQFGAITSISADHILPTREEEKQSREKHEHRRRISSSAWENLEPDRPIRSPITVQPRRR